ncbi:MAG: hypothetical protein QNJ30_27145 [Kiloniellales bacterium]|nr:hypothetical protein [Kiloniellales bacterium]
MRRVTFPGIVMLGALLLAAPLLSGCSVGMAAAGTEDPNLAVCKAGATRLDIERELGGPRDTTQHDDGSLECVYEYEIGNEPSPGRAVVHGTLDVLTFGIWELVGTPIEALQGTKYEMTVVYGPDGIAKSVKTEKLDTTPPKDDES